MSTSAHPLANIDLSTCVHSLYCMGIPRRVWTAVWSFFFLRFKRGKDFKKRLLFALRSKEDLFLKQLLDTYLNRDVSNSSSDQTKLWSMILTVYSFLSFNLDLFGKKTLQLWQGTNLPFCQCDYTHRLLWSPPWGWIIPHSTIFGGTGNIERIRCS